MRDRAGAGIATAGQPGDEAKAPAQAPEAALAAPAEEAGKP